jgi:hypothetical protein
MRGANEYAEQSEQNELPHVEYSYRRTFTTALINFIAYAAASALNVRRGLLSPEVLLHIARLAYVMYFALGTRAHVICRS